MLVLSTQVEQSYGDGAAEKRLASRSHFPRSLFILKLTQSFNKMLHSFFCKFPRFAVPFQHREDGADVELRRCQVR